MIQNQSGRFPTRWDKSGCVVEVKGHDQYVVKVTGTGRLTLRNRRFLRRYEPHSFHAQVPSTAHQLPSTVHQPPSIVHQPQTVPTQERTSAPQVHTADASPAASPLPVCDRSNNLRSINETQPLIRPTTQPPTQLSIQPPTQPSIQLSTQPSIQPPTPPPIQPPSQPLLQQMTQPSTQPSETLAPQVIRRSRREKSQATVYDAHSGKYVAPDAGDNEVL